MRSRVQAEQRQCATGMLNCPKPMGFHDLSCMPQAASPPLQVTATLRAEIGARERSPLAFGGTRPRLRRGIRAKQV